VLALAACCGSLDVRGQPSVAAHCNDMTRMLELACLYWMIGVLACQHMFSS